MDTWTLGFLSMACFGLAPVSSVEDFVMMPVELAPVPCNDKAVEKLSRLAVTYINEDRSDGYKFALNRIANVHLHAQGPAGNVYYLDLDVLETKCHTRSPKPWKRCDVRPFMETQISGNCNTTILHTSEGYSYLYSYDCALVPDAPEKLQQICPTCPLLLSTDDPDAMTAAQTTLAAYKRQSTLGAGLGVKSVTRASAQDVPVKAIFVEYTVQECPEGITERGTCQPLTLNTESEGLQQQTAGFCTGSVFGEIDLHPDAQVSCEMFKVQNVDVAQPVQPQGHDLLLFPTPKPTLLPRPDDFGNDLQPAPVEPPSPTAAKPQPLDPLPPTQVPTSPPAAAKPPAPLSSSSSESEETLTNQQQQHSTRPQPLDSSSEEMGGPVALRPPFSFRYQRRDRRKRQALVQAAPTHNPVFLSEFPFGSSPFRSCPGPARYATV